MTDTTIPEEAVTDAADAIQGVLYGTVDRDARDERPDVGLAALAALTAALPALRRQWADETAQAIEDKANWRFVEGEGRARHDSARIVREFGETKP
ncbi:hypothetical protein [Kribbella deserti]|uniref:DUF222 domain-containing protein n=1 Tax=Kribbella deserti TaxID=1926257 RepID=A0ABV6QNE2_9ACTN